ncbi:MAG: hypothetical protein ACTSX4_02855, partial [Candidatus Helarchaeota archaeon]
YQGITIDYFNETTLTFLTQGNREETPDPSMYPQENLQTILISPTQEMYSSKTLELHYSSSFQADNPNPDDWISIKIDAAYILLFRPLRPIIKIEETSSVVPINENLSLLCNYYGINGTFPHPITKLEVYKQGIYEELPVQEGFSLLKIQFTQTGIQDYHFKITFGEDYFYTEDKYVLVTKRDRQIDVKFTDIPNTLLINVSIRDALNSSPCRDLSLNLNVYHEGSSIWNDALITNNDGWILLTLDITGNYYLHQYRAEVQVDQTADYNAAFLQTDLFQCTNCTPNVQLVIGEPPQSGSVLDPIHTTFNIDSIQPINRTWILNDGIELCEVSADIGTNEVYFLGEKGTHVYQIKTENILGESSFSDAFMIQLAEASATLHSEATILLNTLQIIFYVDDDGGLKIAVPIRLKIWDHGTLSVDVMLQSSTTTVSSFSFTFNVFENHAFEVKLMINDTRYEGSPIIISSGHEAIPLNAIIVEVLCSSGMIGVGTVFFIKKKRN